MCMKGFCKWAHALIYLDSLDARADNRSVVVLGAAWTCILTLPQKMEGTAITSPLWTVTVEEYKLDHEDGFIPNYSWYLICPKGPKVQCGLGDRYLGSVMRSLAVTVGLHLSLTVADRPSLQASVDSKDLGIFTNMRNANFPSVIFWAQSEFGFLLPPYTLMSQYQHQIHICVLKHHTYQNSRTK